MAATIKLLIDDKRKKVVYAEAGKAFIDFLFGLMQVPLGSLIEQFHRSTKTSNSGSLANIYKSMIDLDDYYLLNGVTKKSLLSPKMPSPSTTKSPQLLQTFEEPKQYSLYSSSSDKDKNKEEGFVSSTTQYMVMDDLSVKLMSTISSITVINDLDVKSIGCLKEKTVTVDFAQALELVKVSFWSATVLTDVFIGSSSESDMDMAPVA